MSGDVWAWKRKGIGQLGRDGIGADGVGIGQDVAFFDGNSSGQLTSRLSNDASKRRHALDHLSAAHAICFAHIVNVELEVSGSTRVCAADGDVLERVVRRLHGAACAEHAREPPLQLDPPRRRHGHVLLHVSLPPLPSLPLHQRLSSSDLPLFTPSTNRHSRSQTASEWLRPCLCLPARDPVTRPGVCVT